MASNTGENVITDVIATRPPPEVVEQIAHDTTEKKAYSLDVVSSSDGDDEYRLPTDEEKVTLRKVSDDLSIIAFGLCLVEFAERASYYGAKNIFSNFIQFPLPAGGNGAGAPPKGTQETAGALNMGLQASSGFVLLFQFLSYVIPIFGGWWADVKVGRYYAIVVGVLICGVAHIIQIIGAIPSVLQRGTANAAPPFIIGLLMLAVGAGIFKPNIAPTVLDQTLHSKEFVKTLKSGEKVIVSPELTATRTMLIFYGSVNLGAFYMLATSYAEKDVGYWLAFLLSGIIYFLLPILLFVMYKRVKKSPPSGSDLTSAFKIVGTALRKNKFQFWKKGFWDSAKPSVLAQQGITVSWSDKLVDDVKRTIDACHIFFFFPIYNLNDGGIGSVPTNQGAAMVTNGAPNDLLNNFNPLTIIVFVPFLSYVFYPTLHRFGIKLGPVDRLNIGFFLAALSSVAGAIVQHYVYKFSPCGYYASTCDTVADISIWWQIPNNVLSAMSECFCNVTAYELAYSRAPPSMRGLVMAIFLFMTALSAALGEILLPVQVDPYLVWLWAAPAVALVIQTIWLNIHFRHLNHEEFLTSEIIEETPITKEVQETKV
ncbi:hypothetical protein ZTR_09080 [Talaromyces verruculosus]|nr:hypothetical protein ZTR_09080 [Talaromyces verruculosus]